jgi:hypothetical protein
MPLFQDKPISETLARGRNRQLRPEAAVISPLDPEEVSETTVSSAARVLIETGILAAENVPAMSAAMIGIEGLIGVSGLSGKAANLTETIRWVTGRAGTTASVSTGIKALTAATENVENVLTGTEISSTVTATMAGALTVIESETGLSTAENVPTVSVVSIVNTALIAVIESAGGASTVIEIGILVVENGASVGIADGMDALSTETHGAATEIGGIVLIDPSGFRICLIVRTETPTGLPIETGVTGNGTAGEGTFGRRISAI